MDGAFRKEVAASRENGELYFASLLPEDAINNAYENATPTRLGRIYTPAITVWVFLAQILSTDHSCRDAVTQLIAWLVAAGKVTCSAATGAYCIARDKLPEMVCSNLARYVCKEVEEQAPPEWNWLGHRVLDVDGSTVTMADTPENQAEYPQQSTQAPGCGFPIMRILVVFVLSVGTVLELAVSPYKGKRTGENSMFRALHPMLKENDVVLADRYFAGWFDVASLRQRGVHFVIRKHQLRGTDFRTGRRLGKDDHIVIYVKPQRPKWMSVAEYESLPSELEVREVRVRVCQRGFRTKELIITTSLLDAKVYTAAEIAKLYRRRWQAELDLRSLKVVMQMDHLRCKKPHRVRNELYMHIVGYNLIRKVIALAAMKAGKEPWQVSFKGALQTLNRFLPMLMSGTATDRWCDELLAAIATHEVGNRPDRVEPRLKKRRPKQYKLMQKPRKEYKTNRRKTLG